MFGRKTTNLIRVHTITRNGYNFVDMDLKAYLISKKIDPEALKRSEKEKYNVFEMEFAQMHPESFTAQKLFLINKLRRKYPLAIADAPKEEKVTVKVKPKIVPRIK